MVKTKDTYYSNPKKFKSALMLSGTTQTALAGHLGISREVLNRYINAKRPFPEHHFDVVCEQLKVHRQEVIELVKEL